MSYKLIVAPAAQKSLRKVDNTAFKRLTTAITKLEENARPKGCKKLTGGTDEYRIRVGDYRIIYSIHDKMKKVIILALGHRREIYR